MKKIIFIVVCIFPFIANCQTIVNITGRVVYENGKPVNEATVTLQEKSITVSTSYEGAYIIPVNNLDVSSSQKVTICVYKYGYKYEPRTIQPSGSGNVEEITMKKISGFYVNIKDISSGNGIGGVSLFCSIASDSIKLTDQIGLYLIPVNDLDKKGNFFISASKPLEYNDEIKSDLSMDEIRNFVEIKMTRINTDHQYELLKSKYLEEINNLSIVSLQKDTMKILESEIQILKIYSAIQSISNLSVLNNIDRKDVFYNPKTKKFINDIMNNIEFLKFKKEEVQKLNNSISFKEKEYDTLYSKLTKKDIEFNSMINLYNNIFEVGVSLYSLYISLNEYENTVESQSKLRRNLNTILLGESSLYDKYREKLTVSQKNLFELSISNNTKLLEKLYK